MDSPIPAVSRMAVTVISPRSRPSRSNEVPASRDVMCSPGSLAESSTVLVNRARSVGPVKTDPGGFGVRADTRGIRIATTLAESHRAATGAEPFPPGFARAQGMSADPAAATAFRLCRGPDSKLSTRMNASAAHDSGRAEEGRDARHVLEPRRCGKQLSSCLKPIASRDAVQPMFTS